MKHWNGFDYTDDIVFTPQTVAAAIDIIPDAPLCATVLPLVLLDPQPFATMRDVLGPAPTATMSMRDLIGPVPDHMMTMEQLLDSAK